jgi:hypothetical protein
VKYFFEDYVHALRHADDPRHYGAIWIAISTVGLLCSIAALIISAVSL